MLATVCGEGNEDMEHLYECKKTGELRNQWNTSKYDLLSDNTDELTRTSLFLSQVETLMRHVYTFPLIPIALFTSYLYIYIYCSCLGLCIYVGFRYVFGLIYYTMIVIDLLAW